MSRSPTPVRKGFQGSLSSTQGFSNSTRGLQDESSASFTSPIFALNPYAYYDVSNIDSLFQDDLGLTPVTASGQSVGMIKDLSGNDLHFTQSSAVLRPTYTESGSDKYLYFGGAHWMQVDTSVSLFKFFHNGLGGSTVIACRYGDLGPATSTLVSLGSFSLASVQIGTCLFYGGGLSQLKVSAGAVSGYCVNDGVTDAGLRDVNLTHGFTYETAATPDFNILVDDVSIKSGSQLQAPRTDNSTGDLTLGATSALTGPLEGRVYGLYMQDDLDTSGDLTIVDTYFQGLMS